LLGALRALEGMRLLTATDWGTGLRVECSHNRIREVACDQLGADEARDLHRALATTLEALVDEHGGWEPALEKMPDCEALLEHWIGAGDCAKTVQYARLGAERALSAHAFERAVSLYRVALSSLSPLHPRARALREGLANALTLAGRGGEAARVFLGLIPGASRQDALRYRTLATCQLLRGGELEAGFVELVRAERHLQVRFPRSGAEALARLVPHRVRNRCAETRLTAGIPGLAAGELGVHMGVLWEVAAAVSCADFARGSVYAAELLRRAVQAGDSEHIAAACGLEAVNAVCENRMARAERMIALSERAAARCGDPELIARVRGMHGICRQLQGRWLQAVRLCRESQQQLERLERLNWDYTMMSWFELVAAAPSGRVGELVTRVPSALRRAQARGDVYGATSFRTHRASWAWLGVDKPLEADAQVDIAERDWVPRGFQFQHWYMLFSRSEIDLYRGTPHRALELMEDAWPRARFLRLVRPVRVDMLFTRARLLLAAARANYRPVLVRRARADGLALLRDGQAWSIALGELVLALAASFSSKREALQRLERAERCLIDADMLMHVYAVRARRGQWQGGAAGDALAETALGGARSLGAGRPAAFVDLLAP
ncbi:MAG: hypothetical protein OXU20_41180, partial [Myxococcales bacterium]|nr:hypothetical protein [Myxococcales bacterium]